MTKLKFQKNIPYVVIDLNDTGNFDSQINYNFQLII